MGSGMGANELLWEVELNPPTDLSPVRSRRREMALALIREEALLDAAHSFNTVQLQGIDDDGRLRVGGEILPSPAQLHDAGEIVALGCGACTLGPRLEARVRQLFSEKRAALATALDYLGNELLFALGQVLQEDILASVRRQRLSLGKELQIEDSVHALSAQAAVLRLAGAADIGISLHRRNLLLPVKSTSMVFVIGRNQPKLSTLHNLSLLCQVHMRQFGEPLWHSIRLGKRWPGATSRQSVSTPIPTK